MTKEIMLRYFDYSARVKRLSKAHFIYWKTTLAVRRCGRCRCMKCHWHRNIRISDFLKVTWACVAAICSGYFAAMDEVFRIRRRRGLYLLDYWRSSNLVPGHGKDLLMPKLKGKPMKHKPVFFWKPSRQIATLNSRKTGLFSGNNGDRTDHWRKLYLEDPANRRTPSKHL